MIFKSFSASKLFFVAFFVVTTTNFVSGANVPLSKRDIFDPPILLPTIGTVWTIGTTQNVTWSTADAPENISNEGVVTLSQNKVPISSGPGSASEPLASAFDLRAGFVEVVVPAVTPGDDYEIVLFGDSGNLSKDFTIQE